MEINKIRHGALFNGIGGFQLAVHWMGWENYMHCEIDSFCNNVVNKYFPESICHEDIRSTDFTIYRGAIDILSGGFPCQPYSTAGKRLGKADERHLWPEMLRAIREIQPRWVVGENVRGITNWNGGMVFDEVQADLETEGYEVLPFLLPAAGVGAPHRRDRIWFIAYASQHGHRTNYLLGQDRCQAQENESETQRQERDEVFGERVRDFAAGDVAKGTTTDAIEIGLSERNDEQDGREPQPIVERFPSVDRWRDFPTKPGVCGGNDGIPDRVDRLKSLGNAIVPQVAYQIFKAIQTMEYKRMKL
jgi:DNA (cytosine-5)-methyltransferase 1